MTKTPHFLLKYWGLFLHSPYAPRSCLRQGNSPILSHSTLANYQTYFSRFLRWIQSKYPQLSDTSGIHEKIAREFMEFLRPAISDGTYNKYLQFLKLFWNTIAKEEKKIKNPFAQILPALGRYHSKQPLSLYEVEKLLNSSFGTYHLLFLLGFSTGLRLGDCCTLRWDEIYLDRRIILRIPRKTQNIVRDRQHAVVKIGIPDTLYKTLLTIPLQKRQNFLFPDLSSLYLHGKSSIISRNITKFFHQAAIETKISNTDQTANRRHSTIRGFHSLRYTYISLHAAAGTPMAVIQRNAGHSSPAMTEHYIQIDDESARHYASAICLPAQLSSPCPPIKKQITANHQSEGTKSQNYRLLRQQLHSLAESLPIETVKKILEVFS